MKWFLIFNPFACLKLQLLAICIFTIGYLLAIDVLIIELDGAYGSKHKIASDPEHVYSAFLHHRSASHHECAARKVARSAFGQQTSLGPIQRHFPEETASAPTTSSVHPGQHQKMIRYSLHEVDRYYYASLVPATNKQPKTQTRLTPTTKNS